MNPDPETRCGGCGHPRRLHAVTERTAHRVGCIASSPSGSSRGCGCPRLQSTEGFEFVAGPIGLRAQ